MEKKSCLLGFLEGNNVAPLYPGLQISGMTNGAEGGVPAPRHSGKLLSRIWARRGGFTLIELLVVVLIIGILAAVALPQYKLAVGKARMTQLITLANSVVQAQERYYLANGKYATQWDELDIDLPGTVSNKSIGNSGWRLTLYIGNEHGPDMVEATSGRLPGVVLYMGYAHNTFGSWGNNGGRRACYATIGNALANILCKNATHKTNPETTSGTSSNVYFFN